MIEGCTAWGAARKSDRRRRRETQERNPEASPLTGEATSQSTSATPTKQCSRAGGLHTLVSQLVEVVEDEAQ